MIADSTCSMNWGDRGTPLAHALSLSEDSLSGGGSELSKNLSMHFSVVNNRRGFAADLDTLNIGSNIEIQATNKIPGWQILQAEVIVTRARRLADGSFWKRRA